MGTLGDIRALVVDDLIDERLSSTQIDSAINSAISLYSNKSFWFNRYANTLAIIAATEFYTTDGTITFDKLFSFTSIVNFTGVEQKTLVPKTRDFINQLPTGRTTNPYLFSFDISQLQVYPIPTENGTAKFLATRKYDALVNDTDTNAFSQEAEMLIRTCAKRYLARNVLHDMDLAQSMESLEVIEASALEKITHDKETLEEADLSEIAGLQQSIRFTGFT